MSDDYYTEPYREDVPGTRPPPIPSLQDLQEPEIEIAKPIPPPRLLPARPGRVPRPPRPRTVESEAEKWADRLFPLEVDEYSSELGKAMQEKYNPNALQKPGPWNVFEGGKALSQGVANLGYGALMDLARAAVTLPAGAVGMTPNELIGDHPSAVADTADWLMNMRPFAYDYDKGGNIFDMDSYTSPIKQRFSDTYKQPGGGWVNLASIAPFIPKVPKRALYDTFRPRPGVAKVREGLKAADIIEYPAVPYGLSSFIDKHGNRKADLHSFTEASRLRRRGSPNKSSIKGPIMEKLEGPKKTKAAQRVADKRTDSQIVYDALSNYETSLNTLYGVYHQGIHYPYSKKRPQPTILTPKKEGAKGTLPGQGISAKEHGLVFRHEAGHRLMDFFGKDDKGYGAFHNAFMAELRARTIEYKSVRGGLRSTIEAMLDHGDLYGVPPKVMRAIKIAINPYTTAVPKGVAKGTKLSFAPLGRKTPRPEASEVQDPKIRAFIDFIREAYGFEPMEWSPTHH